MMACGAGVLFAPSLAFAKSDLITFHTNPETPGPNQSVVVSIQSYAVNLDAAKITWYVDKNVVKDGIAEKNIQTITKEFGQTTTIDVVVSMLDGGRYDKQFLLTPAEVDILWEADTSVPPFYKGKALPTYQSIVKLSALARFNSLSSDPSQYSYTWTANQTQGLGTGLGRNSMLLSMKYSGTAIPVSVRVSDFQGTLKSVTTQNIIAVDPLIVFYEDAPLLGIRFGHALTGGVEAGGTSFTIRAVPYFFSNDNLWNSTVLYSWIKDGTHLPLGLDPNFAVITKAGKSAQSETISISLQN